MRRGDALGIERSRERGDAVFAPLASPNAVACFVLFVVVVGLSARHGISGPQAGIELGTPANSVDDPGHGPARVVVPAAFISFTKPSADCAGNGFDLRQFPMYRVLFFDHAVDRPEPCGPRC